MNNISDRKAKCKKSWKILLLVKGDNFNLKMQKRKSLFRIWSSLFN